MTNATTTLILNGPPRSGKDTVGLIMGENMSWLGFKLLMFKRHLYRIGAAMAGVDEGLFIDWCSQRDTKEIPMWQLNGKSPRQWLIFASEEVMKPHFGRDYFGKIAAQHIEEGFLNVFTDGGFASEMVPACERTTQFGGQTFVCRIYRPGCNYDGDSRRYLTDEEIYQCGAVPLDFQNKGTLEDLKSMIDEHMVALGAL